MNTRHLQLIALALATLVIAACQTNSGAPPNRFDQADANHDGFLSVDEVNSYLVTEIFSARDLNKDGKLTREEWIVGNDPAQEKAFRERDANKDGIVTIDEALAYGRKKGMAKKFMAAADKNKDGKLSREEVQAYYASKEGSPRWSKRRPRQSPQNRASPRRILTIDHCEAIVREASIAGPSLP